MGNKNKGLTFWICFGKYAGFSIQKDSCSAKLTLGWASLCILLMDIELVIYELTNKFGKKEAENE